MEYLRVVEYLTAELLTSYHFLLWSAGDEVTVGHVTCLNSMAKVLAGSTVEWDFLKNYTLPKSRISHTDSYPWQQKLSDIILH